jgi:hypothetical protein
MKGMSITGIVTGGIAVLWNIFVTLAFIALLFKSVVTGVAQVKNASDKSTEYVSSSLFSVNEKEVAVTPSYITVEPDLGYSDLSPGATKTGNIVYEVTKDATGLKLQYSVATYNVEDGSKKLYYTLAF